MARFQLCQSREFPGFNVVDLLGRRFLPGCGRALQLMEVYLNIPPFADGEERKALFDFGEVH